MSPKDEFISIIHSVLEDLSEICQSQINDGIIAKTPTEQIMIALSDYAVSAIQALPKIDH